MWLAARAVSWVSSALALASRTSQLYPAENSRWVATKSAASMRAGPACGNPKNQPTASGSGSLARNCQSGLVKLV